MELIQLLLCFRSASALASHVLVLKILVVKIGVQVLVVIDPGTNHVRVLLVEIGMLGLSMHQHRFVEAKMIGGKRLVAPKHVLAPEVGVLAAFVHGSVGLKLLLNEILVLVQGHLHVFGVSVFCHDPVEVTSNNVLLLVETIQVKLAGSPDVLALQFSERALIESRNSLVLAQVRWVFAAEREQVVDFLEGEILAVVVGLGHYLFIYNLHFWK